MLQSNTFSLNGTDEKKKSMAVHTMPLAHAAISVFSIMYMELNENLKSHPAM